ncbi:MAG TPA: glycine betaine ABC transporter substrate-binding protein [Natronosporangium sp.]
MNTRTRMSISIVGLAAMVAVIAACGEEGQSGTEAPESVEGQGCAPIAGEELLMLEDDKALQQAENIIAAVNQDAATPELIAALDAVAATLDTPALIELNRAVDIDRQTPEDAAAQFADARGITDGITAGSGGDVTVGTAEFSESRTIGALYDIALTAAGFEVEVQTIGNRELYAPALQRGELDVVPEYLGSLTEYLNAEVNGADPEPLASSDVDATVTALRDLGEQVGLAFGEPAEGANTNAFAVTRAFAEEHGLRTLSDLAEVCSGADTILGGPPECPQRPFCQPGLEETYGMEFGQFVSLDAAGGPLTKQALRTGEISVGLVLSTDGELSTV